MAKQTPNIQGGRIIELAHTGPDEAHLCGFTVETEDGERVFVRAYRHDDLHSLAQLELYPEPRAEPHPQLRYIPGGRRKPYPRCPR